MVVAPRHLFPDSSNPRHPYTLRLRAFVKQLHNVQPLSAHDTAIDAMDGDALYLELHCASEFDLAAYGNVVASDQRGLSYEIVQEAAYAFAWDVDITRRTGAAYSGALRATHCRLSSRSGQIYWMKRWGGPNGLGQPGHIQLAELMDSAIYHVEERRPGFVPAHGVSVLGPHRVVEVISPEGADPMYGLPMWDGLDAAARRERPRKIPTLSPLLIRG